MCSGCCLGSGRIPGIGVWQGCKSWNLACFNLHESVLCLGCWRCGLAPAHQRRREFAFPFIFLNSLESWNLKIRIFQKRWHCFTFYILELWFVENKDRSEKEYVINMGEGRQSPAETLKGCCPCLLSCGLGDPQIHADLSVITSTFLKKPQSCIPLTSQCSFPQTAHVSLMCIVLLCLPLVCFYLEHDWLMCTLELKPQVTWMEKLLSLDLRTAPG